MKNSLHRLVVGAMASTLLLVGACSDSDSSSDPGPNPPTASLQLFAGNVDASGYVDGVGANARFGLIQGLAADGSGTLYVGDGAAEVRAVRRISPAGEVSTLAGGGTAPPLTDGTGSAAGFYSPRHVAIDANGTISVADTLVSGASGVVGAVSYVRKVTAGGAVTTPFQTVLFPDMHGLLVDGAGNMLIASGTCAPPQPSPPTCTGRITRYSPQGNSTTIIATPGAGGTSNILRPTGLAVDSTGNLYTADFSSRTVNRVDPVSGAITVISSGSSFQDQPSAVAVDTAGNVYVADSGTHTVRKITPVGTMTTVAGVAGQPGFMAGALPGLLREPRHLAIVGNDLYIGMDRAVAVIRNRP
ncbi:hypothetical protein [Usitatibacter palustris]|uniref:NHL repeat-containing protein n=1 Tax=Usitatibacter palustris TaxID=2732487 RepID=A0A6M4H682_9PROT|nr:hypothetical protein [Usitatibacter palustris]QJR14842.1 hypothetical protein DSM104440_01656 [Usitatibacter palustris]